jgi:squalene-hopene/tetraprenyl-beta-curcumene cyclase
MKSLGLASLGILLSVSSLRAAACPVAAEPDWNTQVDRAIAYLRTAQSADGSWSGNRSPGVTGIVLTGLLRTGKVSLDDPMVAKALAYIEGLVNAEHKHIAGKDPRPQLQNYVTSVNLMALAAANRADRYKAIMGEAAEFLKKLQWDEGEGRGKADDFFGGAGYDSKSRPDLSNTQFFLDALVDAGVPRDDPAFKRAMVFVSRCQNIKGEHNDQPWAGKIDDGSFIYSPAAGGQTKVDGPHAVGLPGYGSMTYAGVKSMIYCGATKDDPRIKKALEWIRKNYSVDANPGMPISQGERGLFYYYHTMAKCLDLLGEETITDAAGTTHHWRKDLLAALGKRQRPDGSWVNSKDQWMEGDANLVTGYALMALGYCKPKP